MITVVGVSLHIWSSLILNVLIKPFHFLIIFCPRAAIIGASAISAIINNKMSSLFPGQTNSQGGGAFAFVDSSGNRYGGTYGLKDGKVVSRTGDPFPPNFAANIPYQNFADNIPYQNFGDIPYQSFADTVYPLEEDFGQAYFSNLENLLQE